MAGSYGRQPAGPTHPNWLEEPGLDPLQCVVFGTKSLFGSTRAAGSGKGILTSDMVSSGSKAATTKPTAGITNKRSDQSRQGMIRITCVETEGVSTRNILKLSRNGKTCLEGTAQRQLPEGPEFASGGIGWKVKTYEFELDRAVTKVTNAGRVRQ
jgi:hypothetical protein